MRKIFTLSLAVAGLMAFNASALAPKADGIVSSNAESLPIEQRLLSASSTEKLSLSEISKISKFQKSTRNGFAKAPVIGEDGLVIEGQYAVCATEPDVLRDENGNPIDANGNILGENATEDDYVDVDNIFGGTCIVVNYNESNFVIAGFINGDIQNNQIWAEYDKENEMICIPSGQLLFQLPYGGTTVDVCLYALSYSPTAGVDITETADLYLKRSGDMFVATSTAQKADGSVESVGTWWVGARLNGRYLTYVQLLGVTMSPMNGYVQFITSDGFADDAYYQEATQGIYGELDGDKMTISNFYGNGNFNLTPVFDVDKVNKTVTLAESNLTLYANNEPVQFGFIDVTSEDGPLPVVGTYTYDEENETTLINFPSVYAPYNEEYGLALGLWAEMTVGLFGDFFGDSAAIDDVKTDVDNSNAPVEFFNLQGVKVSGDNLGNGVYIRRQGSDVQKVLVK